MRSPTLSFGFVATVCRLSCLPRNVRQFSAFWLNVADTIHSHKQMASARTTTLNITAALVIVSGPVRFYGNKRNAAATGMRFGNVGQNSNWARRAYQSRRVFYFEHLHPTDNAFAGWHSRESHGSLWVGHSRESHGSLWVGHSRESHGSLWGWALQGVSR